MLRVFKNTEADQAIVPVLVRASYYICEQFRILQYLLDLRQRIPDAREVQFISSLHNIVYSRNVVTGRTPNTDSDLTFRQEFVHVQT